ncbi:transmembrane protein 233-like [Lineus longissimus]|uniref:transmembrane protein 233-like n=1 Tax=Lineus longissimus TaxID=88925 RepID=UPI002B4F57F9
MFTGGIEMAEGPPHAAGKYSKVSSTSNMNSLLNSDNKAAEKRLQPSNDSELQAEQKPPEQEELETYPEKPASYIWLSILCLFYNFAAGIFALVFSILSDNAWSRDDTPTARRYGRIALLLCVIGVIITILIVIIVLPIIQTKPV